METAMEKRCRSGAGKPCLPSRGAVCGAVTSGPTALPRLRLEPSALHSALELPSAQHAPVLGTATCVTGPKT